jgi:photosystem II stability/assembly factor-like uncharacterized protein
MPSAYLSRTSFRRSALFIGLLFWACGAREAAVVSIALHPTNPNIVYVATNEAVHKTRDGGTTWEQFPGFTARRVTTLAIDPKLPATVYAGTMGDAIYKSPDGGQHWLPHNVGLKEHVSFVNEIVFHPGNTEVIYLATTVGAFVTKNGGREWEERMTGMKEVHIVTCLTMDPKHPRVLYAGTTGGTYRSEDGGASWQKKNSGLIPDDVLNASMALGVNVLAVDPLNSDIVYAGSTKGLFRSTNRAEYWEQIGQALSEQFISTLVLHPTNPDVFYIGGPGGVLQTSDGGKTWQPRNQGLATLNVRTIVMSRSNPQLLYAGTNGSGLYRSTDGGQQWAAIPLTGSPGTAP